MVELGSGSTGRVVAGRYKGQDVAVKILASHLVYGSGVDEHELRCFQHEVMVLSRIRHPNVSAPDDSQGRTPPVAVSCVLCVSQMYAIACCGSRAPNVLPERAAPVPVPLQVVRLLGGRLEPPLHFLVEELLTCSLDDLIYGSKAKGQPQGQPAELSLRDVLAIARDVAAGLAFLHPTVVHRGGHWGPVSK